MNEGIRMTTPQPRRPYLRLSEAAALGASLSSTPAPLHVEDLVEQKRELGSLLRALTLFTTTLTLFCICGMLTMLAEDPTVVLLGYIAMLVAGAVTIIIGEVVADEVAAHAPAISIGARRRWERLRRRLRLLAGGSTALSIGLAACLMCGGCTSATAGHRQLELATDDAGADAAVDQAMPTGACGNGNTVCAPDQVCFHGDCLTLCGSPSCWQQMQAAWSFCGGS